MLKKKKINSLCLGSANFGFNYFDEDIMLEIRLSTLYDYVDKFIICEATLDHAGNEKKLNFDINKFKKYEKKN